MEMPDDDFKEAMSWLYSMIRFKQYNEEITRVLNNILYEMEQIEALRRENEELKARIKLFEITGKDDPSIVECCFSGEYKMDDKQTIEHLYKWFKDFFLLVGRYVKDDKND